MASHDVQIAQGPAGGPGVERSPLAEIAPAPARGYEQEFRVLIAGGGVAALEAVLALAEHRDAHPGSGIEVEMVCPDPDFTLRALAVARPFGADSPRSLELAGFCREQGVALRADRVEEVWGTGQRVLLASGEDVFYDALLLAFGAQPYEALPGAHTFRGAADAGWFTEMLDGLEAGEIRDVSFVVPRAVHWSLPLYELALMTAHRLRGRGIHDVKLRVVTGESEPLFPFLSAAGKRIAGLLKEADIELVAADAPVRFDDDRLLLEGGREIATERVVSLPGLRVPPVAGVPGGAGGLIATDAEMRVRGLHQAWAAGDATWLPIKQGGLAAQQAEVASASIVAAAGAPVEVPPFNPILRAAMLTGEGVEFMRSELEADAPADFASSPLWWPPAKVAGRRLAPYLARLWTGEREDALRAMEDLEVPDEGDRERTAAEHRDAVELSLAYAENDAAEGDLPQALRWLDIAERLNVALPPDLGERRRQWEREINESDDQR